MLRKSIVEIPCHTSNLKPSSIYCIFRKIQKKAKKANQEKLILINKNKYTFCGKIELKLDDILNSDKRRALCQFRL